MIVALPASRGSTSVLHDGRQTDSRGDIITGTTSDPVKTIVARSTPVNERAFRGSATILFAADYFHGRPDPSTQSSQLMETNNQPQKGESR